MTDKFVQLLINIATIVMLFGSIIMHEVSHGFAANLLGDDTAKRRGRLSLNPLVHIDMFGTIILPLVLYFVFKFPFGYAKPVPINPYNFKNMKRDMGLSALAGPMSNFILAGLLSLIIRVMMMQLNHPASMLQIPAGWQLGLIFLSQLVLMNLFLGIFNLIPFPPLDGSKVFGAFLPDDLYYRYVAQERIGMVIFVSLMLLSSMFHLDIFGRFLTPIVMNVFHALTGL